MAPMGRQRIRWSMLGCLLSPALAMQQRVALVTGASRGIGKGVAVELGRAGFSVYALGRSSRTSKPSSGRQLSAEAGELTVEATAELIDAAGGRGHAVCCDIEDESAIAAAIERIEQDEGRLDVLCCSAFKVPSQELRAPFWTQGRSMWDTVNSVGLRSVYLTCCAAAPLMISTAAAAPTASSPLMVLISSFGGKAYTFNVAYGVGKAAIDRLAADMAVELAPHGVATCALYPGVVRTEGNLELDREGKWDQASGGLDLAGGESPAFSGRAVAALAALPRSEQLERSGKVQVVAELATELEFSDLDGSQPASIRSLKFLLPNFAFPQMEAGGLKVPSWAKENVPDVLLPWSIFSASPPPKAADEAASNAE